MGNELKRFFSMIAALPRRILRTFSWGHEYSDAGEIENARRGKREVWRHGVDEVDPPKTT